MPVHDWEKVGASVFHAFHNTWIGTLQTALNTGILPPDYYALCEQSAGQIGPDVLTLQRGVENAEGLKSPPNTSGGVAGVAARPPKVRIVQQFEERYYTRKRKSLVIRHQSDDRIVAMIEIVSPGNKASNKEYRRLVDKIVAALDLDIHLLIVDLFPPTKRDAQGIHGSILSEFGGPPYDPPPDKPLTLVSYSAAVVQTAYVEPIAVGDLLPAMPLFLEPESYVDVPLEATYQAAYLGVPRHCRETLEK